MKAKAAFFLAGILVAAVVYTTFYQWHRYEAAVQSLATLQRMTPGKTQVDEVKEALGEEFSTSGNCPSEACAFTRSFDNMWLDRLIFRKSLIFSVDVSVKEGVVTYTSVSFKVAGPDSWVGAAVLRSRYTACKDPESSCTSFIVGDDRRIPLRVVSTLPADTVREVCQPAYDFDLKCLLPFSHCATIDDIYPEWKRLPTYLQ